jgi:hypothetical protein
MLSGWILTRWPTDQYHAFLNNRDTAIEFIESCRRHERDDLLIQKPGSNRGTPV